MKIIANYERRSINEAGNPELTFEIKSWGSKREIEELNKGDYTLEIRKVKSKRSLQQNALLWELIGEIGRVLNGSNADDMDIYTQILQMSGAKVEYLECIPEAVESFRKVFRTCKVVEERVSAKGVKTVVIAAYIGSSKMNTAEMTHLIDTAMSYAEKLGINTDAYSVEEIRA